MDEKLIKALVVAFAIWIMMYIIFNMFTKSEGFGTDPKLIYRFSVTKVSDNTNTSIPLEVSYISNSALSNVIISSTLNSTIVSLKDSTITITIISDENDISTSLSEAKLKLIKPFGSFGVDSTLFAVPLKKLGFVKYLVSIQGVSHNIKLSSDHSSLYIMETLDNYALPAAEPTTTSVATSGINAAGTNFEVRECTTKSFPLRRNTVQFCGYPDKPHGWLDLDNTGYADDYCRFVGDAKEAWWTCTKSSDPSNVYSAKGVYTFDAVTEAKLIPLNSIGTENEMSGCDFTASQITPESVIAPVATTPPISTPETPTTSTPTTSTPTTSTIQENFSNVSDCGYVDKNRGFMTIDGKKSFCRYVGGSATTAPYWACAIPNATSQYTTVTAPNFSDSTQFTPLKMDDIANCPVRRTDISDCGYTDRARGWIDLTGDGQTLDYCRDVGGIKDSNGNFIENPFWSCTLRSDLSGSTKSWKGTYNYDDHKNKLLPVLPGETCYRPA